MLHVGLSYLQEMIAHQGSSVFVIKVSAHVILQKYSIYRHLHGSLKKDAVSLKDQIQIQLSLIHLEIHVGLVFLQA